MIVQIAIHQMIMIRKSSIIEELVGSLIYSEMLEKQWLQRVKFSITLSANIAQMLLRICTSAINLATRPIIMNVRIAKRIFLRGWSTISFASLVTDPSATSTGLKNVSSLLKTQYDFHIS
jgi:hypothetical protein